MPITSAYSTKALPAAITDLKAQSADAQPRAVICFASAKYDPSALSQQMKAAFPQSCVIGCSTAGELTSGKMLQESVVALFLDAQTVEDVSVAVVENISEGSRVREAFAEFERHFHAPVSSLDIQKHVGLVLVDGLSGAEEGLMEKLGDRADVFFVGGSAGDDLKFQRTHVWVDGKAYTNAALLVLLRLPNGFEIIKTQSCRSIGKVLEASQVDEPQRKIIQFDHKPAIQAYAEAIGVSAGEAPAHFMQHPLGLMIQGEPYVRSPQRVEDEAMRFYCQVREGTKLEVLEATDIVADTRAVIEARKAAGRIAGLIDFGCILRTLQLRSEERCDQYGAIFAGFPAVGFSTYGEEYLGHMNQTSTMLLFR
jgi:hypothetical protein